MGYKIVKGDITEMECDVIVNASNAIGYMGGGRGIETKLPGVAEAIHYKTKGVVEKEARKMCRKISWLSSSIYSKYQVGDVFITGNGGLKCKYIFHAVTMFLPGSKSQLEMIDILVHRIILKARMIGIRSIALPLLGTGTGGLDRQEVLNVYDVCLSKVSDIEVSVVIYE